MLTNTYAHASETSFGSFLNRVLQALKTWRFLDLAGYLAAWMIGIGLSITVLSLLGFMFIQGVKHIDFSLIVTQPVADADQSKTGGILDPILGTLMVVALGTLIAIPFAVGAAFWVVEYQRPRLLARIVESSIEMIAGSPSIVIAMFGLTIFQSPLMAWASFTDEGGGVYGRSFIAAGTMMSLIAIPPIFSATRQALLDIPNHIREASYALGKTSWSTIVRILFPAVRPNIATGAALGMGRIAGDTAIIVVLLGASLRFAPSGEIPGFNLFQGGGSTLTSYVFENSPAGEGGAPEKAYAAAFVLLVLILTLNLFVGILGRRDKSKELNK